MGTSIKVKPAPWGHQAPQFTHMSGPDLVRWSMIDAQDKTEALVDIIGRIIETLPPHSRLDVAGIYDLELDEE